MTKRLPLVLSWLLAVCTGASCRPTVTAEVAAAGRDVELTRDETTYEAIVPPNATLETLLAPQLSPELTRSIVEAVNGVFNPRRLRAAQPYRITRGLDGLFREFRYDIDADTLLRVVFRDRPGATAASIDVALVPLPKEYAAAAAEATISPDHTSLIDAFDAAGENLQLPMRVAEIFGGEVDFNSELRRGDVVRVLFDRATREGEFIGYGDVKAVVLTVGARTMTAVRYVAPDGKSAFYDGNGRSMRRQFLRSPLPISTRITSGFSQNRFHPINRASRPHLGVDYGAPFGTPVNAVAAGIVEAAEWSGEAGRMVRIRHTGGYKTAYLHLSSFAPGIRPGTRIEQGALVGRVGQTGSATGPHLDYRVMRNGAYLNPATAFSKLPQGDPIAPSELPDFQRQREEALLDLTTRLSLSATPAAASR